MVHFNLNLKRRVSIDCKDFETVYSTEQHKSELNYGLTNYGYEENKISQTQ